MNFAVRSLLPPLWGSGMEMDTEFLGLTPQAIRCRRYRGFAKGQIVQLQNLRFRPSIDELELIAPNPPWPSATG